MRSCPRASTTATAADAASFCPDTTHRTGLRVLILPQCLIKTLLVPPSLPLTLSLSPCLSIAPAFLSLCLTLCLSFSSFSFPFFPVSASVCSSCSLSPYLHLLSSLLHTLLTSLLLSSFLISMFLFSFSILLVSVFLLIPVLLNFLFCA